MKVGQRQLTIATTFLAAFALCALVLVGGHAFAGEEDTNPSQGNTATTRTNNPDGSTTVTTTTTYSDGSTTTTTTYDKEGHDAGTTRVDKQTKDGETTTTTTTYDGNGHETGKTIERVDKEGNKTIIIIDAATGGVKSSTTVPAEKPKTPPPGKPIDLPPDEYKPFKLGLKYTFTASPGLNTETFTLPSGSKISVNFPDDMSAGDTITGTVRTEVAGEDEKQRARNQSELDKYVLLIGGQPTRATEKMFTRTIPTNINAAEPFLVVLVNGKQAASATCPVGQSPPSAPQNPQLPTCGQTGRNVVVRDHCDGVIAPTDSCSIGGRQLQPLAESPRMRVMQNTSEVAGPTQIKYSEQGREITGPFQNLGVKLTSPNTNLLRGQRTTLEVVALVKGIQQDVSLDLVNDAPSIVSISGGDNQHFTIHPVDVQANGTYQQNFTVTANQAGAWGTTATVSCVGTGGPKAAASPAVAAAHTPIIPVPIPTPMPSPYPAGGTPSPTPTPTPSPSPCCSVSPHTYTVTYLGTLPPPDSENVSIAVGINDSEDTVGRSNGKLAPGAAEPHAFSIYPADAPLVAKNDLGWPTVPAGGDGSIAYGVNASGHVVGNWYIPPAPLAFTYPFWFDGTQDV